MEITDDRCKLLEKKSRLFSLLAQALNYPDRDLEDRLSSGTFNMALADSLRPFCPNGLLQQVESLRVSGSEDVTDQREDRLLRLEKDYTWMCFASKPRLVYLFESVYKEGRLLQESTFEIARLYYDAGLKVNEGFQLPPDHIAVELEFLAYLYYQEAEALHRGEGEKGHYSRQLQETLLEKHLRLFGLSFSEKMEKHAKTDFYRIMARVLRVALTARSMN
jgi:TorA maturation chaperone TorD